MSEAASQERDILDTWMREIRAEADRRRANASRQPRDAGPRVPALNWPQLSITLSQIAPLAQVGSELPPIRRYPGPLRYGAIFVAKVVLYAAKFLITRQREYNLSLLKFIRQLGEGTRNLEMRVVRQEERIRALEAALAAPRRDSGRKAS